MEEPSKGLDRVSVDLVSLLSTNGQSTWMRPLPNLQTDLPLNMGLQQLSTSVSSPPLAQVGASLKFQPRMAASQQVSFRTKQSACMEQSPKSPHSSSGKLTPQKLPSANKQSTQKDPPSKIQTSMSTNKVSKRMAMESLPNVHSAMPLCLGPQQLSSKKKRKLQTEKLPKVQGINLADPVPSSTNNKTVHAEPSKVQNESFESVRTKLRESLATALAFISGKERKIQAVEKTSFTKNTQWQLVADGQVGELRSTTGHTSSCAVSVTPSQFMTSKSAEHEIVWEHNRSCSSTDDAFINENADDSTKIWDCYVKEFEMKHISLEEDTSFSDNFILNDVLLQENGLCWASDINIENSELKGSVDPKRSKLSHDDVASDVKKPDDRTQNLAAKIEIELFRLFGGVNKKYKEKGRSLLFNLKDSNNPELGERVYYGEITPERLCSMTVAELASKELTEWRIAKAEELAQMVVLPDSDVEPRCLVKKTHKGEFPVEVERDDCISVEVALGVNAPTQFPTRTSEGEDKFNASNNRAQSSLSPNETGASHTSGKSEKPDSEVHDSSNNQTFLPQGMQKFMLDEQKYTECLPLLVCLDESMKALDSKPPFKNLHTLPSEKKLNKSDTKDSMSNASDFKLDATTASLALKPDFGLNIFTSKLDHAADSFVSKVDNVDAAEPLYTREYQPDEIDTKSRDKNLRCNLGCGAVQTELDNTLSSLASGGEQIWEGLIQLNISSLVTVLAFFKSGEKASTKEWPSILEVKGRVRVGDFEKFMQELPLSRSRAVMVVLFRWKEGSTSSGRKILTEAIGSYLARERIGYAEPVPGVVLYLCPPHAKTVQMLGGQIQPEQADALASAGDCLIGVVVWRRQGSASKTLSSSMKHPDAVSTAQPSMPPPVLNSYPRVEEVIDEVPPGFGPRAATDDDDDLPEFDFPGNLLPLSANAPQGHSRGVKLARSAKHMRELIHKYGHSEAGTGTGLAGYMRSHTSPWVHGDDDGIPEWQPQQYSQPRGATPQPVPLWGFQAPQPHLPHQHLMPPPPQYLTVAAQRLLPVAAPSPMAMQAQTGVFLQVPSSVWSAVCWQGATAPNVGFPVNGSQRPCHYGGRPVQGQGYGTRGFGKPQVARDWRFVPRSSGV